MTEELRPTTIKLALALICVSSLHLGFILGRASHAAENPAPAPTPAPRRPAAFRGALLVASWYGIPHHGRRTASGETFDMHGLTAAHRTLPFGTLLRVSLGPGQPAVVVRITDRGPFVLDAFGRFTRDLDLSFEAARRLGFVDQGEAVLSVSHIPERSSHGRP